MNSESEGRFSMDELKARNRTGTEKPKNLPSNTEQPDAPAQPIQPIVIQCPLPQALTKLTQQADGINWELEEIRNMLPELKTHTDLTPLQRSLTEIQKSLAQMNTTLEQAGKKNAKRTCKWLKCLPDFDFLTPVKWLALLMVVTAVVLAMMYGAAAVWSNIRILLP